MKNTQLKALARGCAALALSAGACFDASAAFSITTTTGTVGGVPNRPMFYKIDTDAGVVFTVRAYDNGSNTQANGDISSLRYNGVEYTDQSRGSQINGGMDYLYSNVYAVSVTAEAISESGVSTPAATANGGVVADSEYIKITVTSDGGAQGKLTHYYMAKRGDPNVYMGTYFTGEPWINNMVRFIARVPTAVLPSGSPAGTPGGAFDNGTWPDDNRGTHFALESADIFGFTSGPYTGESRSKHYANMRLKDWTHFGSTGPGVGLWFVRDNHEGGSGGPFYRSLLRQITKVNNELTYIVNYGEAQTEAYRLNRLNSYTLAFTDGAAPGPVDTAWFSKMNLLGFVPPESRGGVIIPAIHGRNAKFPYTVGFANASAQYWTDADNDGHASAEGMIPGDYTMTVYKNELAVAAMPVSVSAGTTNILPAVTIVADPLDHSDDPRDRWHLNKGDPSLTPALFRVGEWDGTPLELMNGEKLTRMHPADVRMSNWLGSATLANPYVIGTSQALLHMPAAMWKGSNSATTIVFNLKPSQISATSTYTVRVGVTTGQAGARPQIVMNSWSSSYVGAKADDVWPKSQPASRTLTVGTYRGRNITYDFVVPGSALVAGKNTMKVWVVSGSTSPSRWLSPAFTFDAIDLIKTN